MRSLRFWLLGLCAAVCCSCAGAPPTVLITNLPAYGTTNDLKGKVLNANPATQAVAVFINVPGYGWVSKPTCAQPLTAIQTNGSWSADITTGGSDADAVQVAALLVSTNYNLACVQGAAFLPTNVFAKAIASAIVRREDPYARWINFSGYNWSVKTSDGGLVGPGPNYFSDSTTNVWTDTNGWLHLRITHRSSQWQCAEILSARTFGYGSYRFELNTAVNYLNSRVVLGLFTWSDDPVYADREIDIECARWSDATDTNNAQFVVQPYDSPNQLVRFRVPASVTNSTQLFTWETNRISWQSQIGGYSPNPASSNVISSYAFTNAAAVPRTGDENVDLNLWLDSGNAPTDGQETEVIIKSFQFVPLGTPARAVLGKLQMQTAGQLQCDLVVQPDFRYEVQTSSNLNQWAHLTTILATNDALHFADTNPPTTSARFYRVVTLP